ncbi:MAG: hypothetical protein WC880_00695 [Candidatus Paceibacterota bacterium]
MGSQYEGRHRAPKNNWVAPLFAALSLGLFTSDAGAQSQPDRSFYFNRDPELPLAENIRRFNQMQARRRSGEISDDCMEIIAITERQLRAGDHPEYLDEDVSACSKKEFKRLKALERTNQEDLFE